MTKYNTKIISDGFIKEISNLIQNVEQAEYKSLLNEGIKDTRMMGFPGNELPHFYRTDIDAGPDCIKIDPEPSLKRKDNGEPESYKSTNPRDYRILRTTNIPILDRIILPRHASDAEITNGVLDCAKQTWENDLWVHKYYNNNNREGYVPETIIGLVVQPPKDRAQLFDNNPEDHMNLTRMVINPLDDEFKNGINLETTSTSVLKPRGIYSDRKVHRGGAPDKQLAEIIRNGHGFLGDAYNQSLNDMMGFSLTNDNYPIHAIKSNSVPAKLADDIYYRTANNMTGISDRLMNEINAKLGNEIERETYYSSIGHAVDRLKEDGHWSGVEPMDWRKTLRGVCQ